MAHALVLGGMVGNATGLNQDGLSLDLNFAVDKTLAARRGPTPVFTRGTNATYVGSDGLIKNTTGIDQPRFDHDPVTLQCKGLLIEETRTNLLYNSDTFITSGGNNAWSSEPINGQIISGDSPYSINNSYREFIDVVGNSGRHSTFYSISTPPSSAKYTFSVFLKRNSGNGILRISLASSSSTNFGCVNINLNTGSINPALNSGTVTDSVAAIQKFPNDWYRVSITSTISPVYLTIAFIETMGTIAGSDYGRIAYTTTLESKIKAFGAQLEAGSFPTSYIPTTTGTVARSADICSITSSAFTSFWNQSSGTLVESFEASPNINTSYVSASNGNIASNSIHIDNDTGNIRAVYYSGGSAVATLGLGSIGTIGSVNTIATAYSPNEQAAYRNGGTIQTATGSFPAANLSQINIGSDERSATPNIYYSNKCIKSLRYYKKRIPNAKLQALTV